MPANLSVMLRSVLKARQTASSLELRFLQEMARTLPTATANWSSVKASRISRRHTGARRRERRPKFEDVGIHRGADGDHGVGNGVGGGAGLAHSLDDGF